MVPNIPSQKRALYVLDFTRALLKEFEATLDVLDENIRKNSYEDDEESDVRTSGYQEDSMQGSAEPDEEPPAKRTRRVLSYYGPISDEDEELPDSSVYKRSGSNDDHEFKVKKEIQLEAIEGMLSLGKSSGSKPSTTTMSSRRRRQSHSRDPEDSDTDDEEGEIHDDDDD